MMLTNIKRLFKKTVAIFSRCIRAVYWLPIRLFRLIKHFWTGVAVFFVKKQPRIPHWWQDFAFLFMDLVAVPEVFETAFDFGKWNTRPLSPLEKKLAASVFGSALNLDAIRMDDRAKIGCQKRRIVYVSYFTINAWGRIRPETFIHELVHVWQFQKLGGAYIPQALRAQKSKEGYNYGGIEALRASMELGGKLLDFNLEQQAEIVGDYYAIREGLKPAWGKGKTADLPVYDYFVAQVRE